jgi:hypothetical protein
MAEAVPSHLLRKKKDMRMHRLLTGIILWAGLAAGAASAQTTTTTVLTGEAFGFLELNSTLPDPFQFDPVTEVNPDGIPVVSNIITISGITEPVQASVSDLSTGGDPRISINGQSYVTSATIEDGDSIRVSILPATGVYAQTYQAEVTIGDGSAIFTVVTRAANTTPDAFSFLASVNADPNTLTTSQAVTITGLEAPASVTVSGAGAPEVSLDGGTTWSAGGSVANNGTVAVRLTSGGFGETRTATVTIGGVGETFSVTTRSSNDTPVLTAFTDQTGVEPGVLITSAAITVTGIESSVNASVSGDGSPEISTDDGNSWVGAGAPVSVTNGTQIRLRLNSGAFDQTRTATLDVNGVTGDFNVTTRSANTTPDAFALTAVTGANPNSLISSPPVTITGIEAAATVTVSGALGSPEFSTDGGVSWVTAGTVAPEGQIIVRLTSGAFTETRVATLTVGGVTGDFSVTTRTQNTTPEDFTFASALAVPGATVTSNLVTLTGFEGSVGISISGVSALYSVDGGEFISTSGTVTAGQTVRVRLTASSTEGATRTASLTVGPVTRDFVVETQDLTPNSFTFAAVTGAALNATVTSAPVQISGITGSVSVSVSEGNGGLVRTGTGPVEAIAWEDWVDHTTALSVTNSGWVQARLTSASAHEAQRSVTITVGNGSAAFTVTTGVEPVSLELASATLPDGEQGVAYTGFDLKPLAQFEGGSAGSPPNASELSWAVTSGVLPTGLTLAPSTGLISGTPSAIGAFGFTITATYPGGVAASRAYTIIVNDPDGSFVIEGG